MLPGSGVPIAIVGEVGANHFDQATVITLAPGGRYAITKATNSKIVLSAQAVAGLWHCSACEVNELFVQPGVILDWGRSDAMKIRFQFDVRRIFLTLAARPPNASASAWRGR